MSKKALLRDTNYRKTKIKFTYHLHSNVQMSSHCAQRNYIYYIYNPVIDLKMTAKISRRLDNCWRYFHREIPTADLHQAILVILII